jgi:hypothetical protein
MYIVGTPPVLTYSLVSRYTLDFFSFPVHPIRQCLHQGRRCCPTVCCWSQFITTCLCVPGSSLLAPHTCLVPEGKYRYLAGPVSSASSPTWERILHVPHVQRPRALPAGLCMTGLAHLALYSTRAIVGFAGSAIIPGSSLTSLLRHLRSHRILFPPKLSLPRLLLGMNHYFIHSGY